MKKEEATVERALNQITLSADLVVAGGGLSGVSTAVTAARQGLQVILVQDRPVLGGNASSEVRLWVLGATSHMGNNNRWSREGGFIDELLVENTFRNPEGNPLILDMILLDKVSQEPNIQLLLNTAVYEVAKDSENNISSLKAFCSQNSTNYQLSAPLFCDATGDGIVGFLAGAAFRMGAESKEEFNEGMAPTAEYGELLGHSLYFYSKDTGKPVNFIAPSFALEDITAIPRFKQFNANEFGCKLWWVEYGGRLDTVHDTEKIKWELWKVVYGVWNYIKNSGKFPEAANLTLEWVGTIPGKRESRRFEGDYMMTQQDLVEQREHEDAVAFGGWSIDLHPADGVYSERPGCNQWHSKGIFQIPYRSLYSKNINNLFLTGRNISVSHVAFGATRVMATCAYVGQVAGIAAAECLAKNLKPKALKAAEHLKDLQNRLMREGQHIPNVAFKDEKDLLHLAQVKASSEIDFTGFGETVLWKTLDLPSGQMLPLKKGVVPIFKVPVKTNESTNLQVELRICSRRGSFTPDVTLGEKTLTVEAGQLEVDVDFDIDLAEDGYVFLLFAANPKLSLGYTERRITGFLSVFNSKNKAVSNNGKQIPPAGTGVDEFEFWCPQRRPNGQNIALNLSDALTPGSITHISNGTDRPVSRTNAWIADFSDPNPTVEIQWTENQGIKSIDIWFDSDFDHPMESVLMTHPENRMPFVIRNYRIKDDTGKEIYTKNDNFQTRNHIRFDEKINTNKLTIEFQHPSDQVPAAIFALRCYAY
ncbi:FAD-dependent oxidoreductase [Pedobacter sp. AW1-32]|uniref:FAD-dependent oxidoreductase n=1 Tax=Pedobacter sp. AW1-32 TaxID=3383026 RepID=UPI003FEDC3B8